jgi:hypothetical protein
MIIPIEIVIFVSGAAALVFSAITMSSLDKIKKSCSAGFDTKQYDMAKKLQIAQIVVGSIIVILAGMVVASSAKNKMYGSGYSAGEALRRAAAGAFGV